MQHETYSLIRCTCIKWLFSSNNASVGRTRLSKAEDVLCSGCGVVEHRAVVHRQIVGRVTVQVAEESDAAVLLTGARRDLYRVLELLATRRYRETVA